MFLWWNLLYKPSVETRGISQKTVNISLWLEIFFEKATPFPLTFLLQAPPSRAPWQWGSGIISWNTWGVEANRIKAPRAPQHGHVMTCWAQQKPSFPSKILTSFAYTLFLPGWDSPEA